MPEVDDKPIEQLADEAAEADRDADVVGHTASGRPITRAEDEAMEALNQTCIES